MPVLELDSVKLHWQQDGDLSGAPVVFVNSLGTDLRLWEHLLPHLPANTRQIRFDLRGQGLTECLLPQFSLTDLTTDLVRLLDHLRIRSCTLVGTSLGGMIAQQMAASRADLVRHLVLTNTAPKMGTAEMWQKRIDAIRESGLAAVADDILQRWFSPSFLGSTKAGFWHQALTQADPMGYVGACHAIAQTDLSSLLGQISQRTLVIGGERDGASPPEQVTAMARMIENSTCKILPGVGHLPSVEAPELLALHLSEFMSEDVNA